MGEARMKLAFALVLVGATLLLLETAPGNDAWEETTVTAPSAAGETLVERKSCKCIDKFKRCTDTWCNNNCNHPGAQYYPRSFCCCGSHCGAPTDAPSDPPTVAPTNPPTDAPTAAPSDACAGDAGDALCISNDTASYCKYWQSPSVCEGSDLACQCEASSGTSNGGRRRRRKDDAPDDAGGKPGPEASADEPEPEAPDDAGGKPEPEVSDDEPEPEAPDDEGGKSKQVTEAERWQESQ